MRCHAQRGLPLYPVAMGNGLYCAHTRPFVEAAYRKNSGMIIGVASIQTVEGAASHAGCEHWQQVGCF